MSFRVRVSGRVCVVCVGLTLVAGTASAQDTPLLPSSPLLSLSRAVPNLTIHDEPLRETHSDVVTSSDRRPSDSSNRGVLVPLYVSFASLQMLDAHSTLRAVRSGGVEQNPLMRGIADKPAALVALKAGVAASTIVLAERVRGRSRLGSIALMAALNSAYAVVVAHNYRSLP